MRRLLQVVWAGMILVLLCAVLVGCDSEPGDEDGEEVYTAIPRASATQGVTAAVTAAGIDCAAYWVDAALVTDLDVRPAPQLEEPEARAWFVEPTFGTCLVRLTDRSRDLSAGDESKGIVNEYARVQAFNADGSRLLAYSTDGWWYLYDAVTLEPLGDLALGVEPRWDAVDPALIYYNDETRLMSYNVESGAKSEIHDFAADFPTQGLGAVWTKFEGRPSRDSRYWGLMAEDRNGCRLLSSSMTGRPMRSPSETCAGCRG